MCVDFSNHQKHKNNELIFIGSTLVSQSRFFLSPAMFITADSHHALCSHATFSVRVKVFDKKIIKKNNVYPEVHVYAFTRDKNDNKDRRAKCVYALRNFSAKRFYDSVKTDGNRRYSSDKWCSKKWKTKMSFVFYTTWPYPTTPPSYTQRTSIAFCIRLVLTVNGFFLIKF